jgi:hypothetical protein
LERAEAQETVNALSDSNTALSTFKRKFEAEFQVRFFEEFIEKVLLVMFKR